MERERRRCDALQCRFREWIQRGAHRTRVVVLAQDPEALRDADARRAGIGAGERREDEKEHGCHVRLTDSEGRPRGSRHSPRFRAAINRRTAVRQSVRSSGEQPRCAPRAISRPRAPGRSSGGVPVQERTSVCQPCRSGAVPRAAPKKVLWSCSVIFPRFPEPTGFPSTLVIGVTSATVPVKNASSAV